MKTATLYKIGEEPTAITPKGKTFKLEELQGYVGGLIELVYTRDRKRLFVVNEEGLVKGLAPNYPATRAFVEAGGYTSSVFVGNVVEMSPGLISTRAIASASSW